MALPVSAKFDIFDWNIRAELTGDEGDALLSDANNNLRPNAFIPFKNVDISGGYVTLSADATGRVTSDTVRSLVTITDLPSGIPDTFTLEFDIILDGAYLPKDFTDTENRLFVGAVNQQAATAGFLFSYQGMALATYPEDPNFILLNGSKDLLFDTATEESPLFESITVRAIVDGENNRLSIYVGDTSEVYVTGFSHLADLTLRYNIKAPASPNAIDHPTTYFPIGDGVALQASAKPETEIDQTADDCSFSISSLRLASSSVIPEDKPVATAFTVRNTLVGTPITLFGGRSYDPVATGGLEYNWEIEIAPETSTAALQGAQRAGVTIGDEVSNNEVTISYKRPTGYANDVKVKLKKGVLNGTLKVEIDLDEALTITLGVDALGDIYSTALDLQRGFSNVQSTGYNAAAVDVYTIDLTNLDSTGLGALPAGEFTLTGGSGSTLANPLFVPDVHGVYVLSLTVFNGIRISDKAKAVFTVGITNQLLEHRPNSKYIFKYLPDFWNLVQDKEQVTSVWSSLTQALSSDLLTLWQNDYSKTIRDISRRYQRRWQYYKTLVEVPAETIVVLNDSSVEVTHITTDVVFPDKIVPPLPIDVVPNINGTHSKKAVISAPGTTILSRGKCLVRGANSGLTVVNVVSVNEVLNQDLIYNTLIADSDAFPYAIILEENNNGFFVRDPDKIFSIPETSDIFSNVVYPIRDIELDQKGVRLFRGPNKTNPIELTPSERNPGNVGNSVRVDGSFSVDTRRYTWQHILPIEGVTIEQVPYISVSSVLDLSEYEFSLGDYVELTVADPYTATDIEVSLPVLIVDGQDIFVDWTSLITALNIAGVVAGDGREWDLNRAFGPEIERVLFVDRIEDTSVAFTLDAIVKAKETFAVDDLVDVPRLGTSTLRSSLHQHVDYLVTDNKIVIKDWIACQARTTENSNIITAGLPIEFHPQLTHASPFSTLVSLGAMTLIVETGSDVGVYGLLDVEVTTTGPEKLYKLTLDQNLEHSGLVNVRVPRYGAYATTVDKLWAEISYFDNKQAIEGNFGLFVGLPEHVLRLYDSDKELDYLSVVRSLWFAFMSGPNFHNLQLALQTFFNIPYSERAGQVIHIEEPTETEEGYIAVEEVNGRASTYRFPFGATMGVNPATDRTIKAFPAVESADVVPADRLDDFNDSKVNAYVKLVDLINFDDYISNPDLIDIQLKGQDIIKKYHTFIVDVPLSVVRSTEIFPLVKDFLFEAKPAYTDFILVGSLKLSDGVDAIDEEFLKPTLLLKDTPHTAAFFALKDGLDSFNKPVVPPAREDVLWAQEDVNLRPDGLGLGLWTVADGDVKERYESGYCEGVLDDYSGDGSFNKRHRVVDVINKLASDIDVVNSRLWVPCTIDVPLDPEDFVEFITGEAVDVYFNGSVINAPATTIWNDAPPVILHIGASVHPRIPFEVESPQRTHPNTYLLLGFENEQKYPSDFYTNSSFYTDEFGQPNAEWAAINCYANESRLDALKVAEDVRASDPPVYGPSGTMYLKGKESGAKATLNVLIPDRGEALDGKYFLLENIFQLDKLVEYGPKSTAHAMLTQYIPLTGSSISDFRTASDTFTEEKLSKEVQMYPYDSTGAENKQFVPSFSPGVYSEWTNLNPVDNLRWGYVDKGPVDQTPTDIDAFEAIPAVVDADLKNIHIGLKIKRIKGFHYTHGFTEFYIPPPNINRVTYTANAADIRIEGYYFVVPDTTQTSIPGKTADTFNGTVGGCWVFFRHADTGVETPVLVEPVFETGLNPGKTVLGIDNPLQTSTGHILIVEIPQLTSGYYDIIVRNYRPYKLASALADDSYHMDEAVIEKAYVQGALGWGGGEWGVVPFGGVN